MLGATVADEIDDHPDQQAHGSEKPYPNEYFRHGIEDVVDIVHVILS